MLEQQPNDGLQGTVEKHIEKAISYLKKAWKSGNLVVISRRTGKAYTVNEQEELLDELRNRQNNNTMDWKSKVNELRSDIKWLAEELETALGYNKPETLLLNAAMREYSMTKDKNTVLRALRQTRADTIDFMADLELAVDKLNAITQKINSVIAELEKQSAKTNTHDK